MNKIPDNLVVFYHDHSSMPGEFKQCLEDTRMSNPEFNLIFLSDESTRRLISRSYPQFEHIYPRIRVPAARSDVARLLALHAFGGFYTDISIGFTTPLHDFYRKRDELFLVRKNNAPPYKNREHVSHILNGVMAAVPKSVFIFECLKRIYFNLSTAIVNYNVNLATGPSVTTETYYRNRKSYRFPITVEDFTTVTANVNRRRSPEINNTWVETQRDGILQPAAQEPEPEFESAWRNFAKR